LRPAPSHRYSQSFKGESNMQRSLCCRGDLQRTITHNRKVLSSTDMFMPTENELLFIRLLDSFGQERRPGEHKFSDLEIAGVTDFLVQDEGATEKLTFQLFPSGVPFDVSFYTGLRELERHLGFSEQTSRMEGLVAVHALRKMDDHQRRKMLDVPLELAGHHFFQALRPFPTVVEKLRFDPEFLVQWFLRLRQRIGNGMAQRDFWQAIDNWSLIYPNDAILGLRQLLTLALDDEKISISARILGNLRVTWEAKSPEEEGYALEGALLGHKDVQRRLVFHRSWITTGWQRKLTSAEFAQCLEQMSSDTEEERAEGFNFLRCLLSSDRITPDSFEHGTAWLLKHAHWASSDVSKYWVVDLARSVSSGINVKIPVLESLLKSVIAIQPVPTKNAGTWQVLEALLVDLVDRNPAKFEELLFGLLDVNPEGILHHFTAPRTFEWLLSEMSTHSPPGFYAHLFFSSHRHRRRFAFALFDELPFDGFPGSSLERRSDDEIALAVLELRLNRLSPEQVSTFLIALAARIETGAAALKQLYEDELLYQAKNLPGACLEKLKPIAERSELVRRVATKAEAYFEALRKCHDSSLTAMQIPGLHRALRIRNARSSRQVHELSQEMSVFAKMFSTSYLLYGGKTYRYCRDGELGETSELQAFSAETELPRLEIIDPEGAAIRRHHTLNSISQLEARIAGRKLPDDA
jgi:hypothetical protein